MKNQENMDTRNHLKTLAEMKAQGYFHPSKTEKIKQLLKELKDKSRER